MCICACVWTHPLVVGLVLAELRGEVVGGAHQLLRFWCCCGMGWLGAIQSHEAGPESAVPSRRRFFPLTKHTYTYTLHVRTVVAKAVVCDRSLATPRSPILTDCLPVCSSLWMKTLAAFMSLCLLLMWGICIYVYVGGQACVCEPTDHPRIAAARTPTPFTPPKTKEPTGAESAGCVSDAIPGPLGQKSARSCPPPRCDSSRGGACAGSAGGPRCVLCVCVSFVFLGGGEGC